MSTKHQASTSSLLVLQHEEDVSPGAISNWAEDQGISMDVHRTWADGTIPKPATGTGIIILGGSMNVGDEHKHPWMADEHAFIADHIDGTHKVLGICLGAQLLAHALGAQTGAAAHKERGWHTVTLTEAGHNHPAFADWTTNETLFQSHGQTFAIPDGGTQLATSEAVDNQAFSYGDDVLGVQFHPEFTPKLVDELFRDTPSSWRGQYVQEYREFNNQPECFTSARTALFAMLSGFFGTD